MILILLVSLLQFYIVNLVFVFRETKKFKVENHFVKRKHLEGTSAS